MKYVLCIAGILLQAAFIYIENKKDFVKAVILKGSASFCFVLIGYLGHKNAGTGFSSLIVYGLIMGMIGDILLNLRHVFPNQGQKIFLLGILIFLVGHILYLIALLPLSPNPLPWIILGAILAAILLAYIFKTMEVKTAFKIFGVVYVGAVVIMAFVALGNLLALRSMDRILFAIGALAFMASDIILIFNTFGNSSKLSMRIANLSLYYAGQLLIALSLFHI